MNKRGQRRSDGGIWGLIGLVLVGILFLGVSSTDTTGLLRPIGIFFAVIGGIGLAIYFIKMATH